MNLKEFLQYRSHCPLCSKKLNISFNHKKKEKDLINYNSPEFSIDLRALKRGQASYQVNFVIDTDSNSFVANIRQKKQDSDYLHFIPFHIINRLKEYLERTGCIFYKYCDCGRYSYYSTNVMLNFLNGIMPQLQIENENFIDLPFKESKTLWIKNNLSKNETVLLFSLSNSITVPLMKFTTEDEMITRISKLLVFS